MTVGILGAGAFGTALAIALGRSGVAVTLWTRDPVLVEQMAAGRVSGGRLPGFALPEKVSVTADIGAIASASLVMLAVPMQQLSGLVRGHAALLGGMPLVACAKGVDLQTGLGPTGTIAAACPQAETAVLTGPSFAADIARGLPTALTLACADDSLGARLQQTLSTPTLRLYRTTDVIGAELGGALKNITAIAAGIVIGAGLGESARAALMTRGYAEMQRLAVASGARAETMAGLAGLGDLVLTCTSTQSRNFSFGLALGTGAAFDPSVTVEGVATARAVAQLAQTRGIEMPITAMVAAVLDGRLTIAQATEALLNRPLKQE